MAAVLLAACSAPAAGAVQLDHVVWVFEENHNAAQALADPGFKSLADSYGYASDFHAITHPSLPNYLAATSGSTHGVTDDASPAAHPIGGASIFGQVSSKGLAESMATNCKLSDNRPYVVHHAPYAYYTAVRSACQTNDVPYSLSQAPDLSRRFTFVTPNVLDDAHDGSLAAASRWATSFIAKVKASAQWKTQRVAVVVVFDEAVQDASNHVYCVVVSNQVSGHRVHAARATLYTLLGTSEDMLGVARLGAAVGAGSIKDLLVP